MKKYDLSVLLDKTCGRCDEFSIVHATQDYPSEAGCRHCNFCSDFVCDRVADKVHENIEAGYYDDDITDHGIIGYFAHKDYCTECRQQEMWEDNDYWFVPFNRKEQPVGYKTIQEVFDELYR